MTEESNAGNPMGTERVSGLVLRTGVPLMISLLINSLYNLSLFKMAVAVNSIV